MQRSTPYRFAIVRSPTSIAILLTLVLVCAGLFFLETILPDIYANLSPENREHLTIAAVIKWLIDVKFISTVSSSLVAAMIVFVSLDAVLSQKFFDSMKEAAVDTDVFKNLLNVGRAGEILKACLHTRTEDELFSDTLYRIIEYQIEHFQSVNNVVRDWRMDLDLRELDDNSFEIHGRLIYFRREFPDRVIIKGILADATQRAFSLQDPDSEFVWALILGGGKVEQLAGDEFRVVGLRIAGTEIPCNRAEEGRPPHAIIYSADTRRILRDARERPQRDTFPCEMEIRFISRQSRKFGLVAANVKYLTRRFRLTVDYQRINFIQDVWAVNHMVGDQTGHMDSKGSARTYTVDYGGWLLPESGVTISWNETTTQHDVGV